MYTAKAVFFFWEIAIVHIIIATVTAICVTASCNIRISSISRIMGNNTYSTTLKVIHGNSKHSRAATRLSVMYYGPPKMCAFLIKLMRYVAI